MLLVQEGGNSPGYNTVTAFLVQQLVRCGCTVHAAREGFRSLVEPVPSLVRLHTGTVLAPVRPVGSAGCAHTADGITSDSSSGDFSSLDVRWLVSMRGAEFRSERFPEFKADSVQEMASKTIATAEFNVVIVCVARTCLI